MTDDVRDSYDAMAELYASLFLGDLAANTNALDWLATFANRASAGTGPVADLGCGPGHVVNHLVELGLPTIGYDLSLGQIEQARKAFPDLAFCVGDLGALGVGDAAFAGIVSRYSLIHLHPSSLTNVFAEWMRALEPGAPVLVSFFGSTSPENHGTPFDHKVVTAYELYPATIADVLSGAGFVDIETGTCDPPAGGRPFSQATVLGHKPA